jgi:hypothetical protein
MKPIDPALLVLALVVGILSVSLAAVAIRQQPAARCVCEARP